MNDRMLKYLHIIDNHERKLEVRSTTTNTFIQKIIVVYGKYWLFLRSK